MEDKLTRVNSDFEPAWSTYMHRKAAARGIPLTGNFELTSRCNFNCRMCYVHDNSHPDPLTAADWLALGEEACRAGMVFLLLTGGEPLLRKDFREIYSGLKKMGLLLSINTNGSLMTDELLEFFAKDPPLRFNVTLYGGSSETYRGLCGVPAYDTVVNNIRRMREAGLQVKINASITPYNREDIPAIYEAGRMLKVPVKGTAYMFPPARINGGKYGEAPARFTPEEAAAAMVTCREQYMTPAQLAQGAAGDLPPEPDDCVDGSGEHVRCRAGRSAFWITWDGRMLPCGMFPIEGYSVRELGFGEAWARTRAYTESLRLPAACTDCPDRTRCVVCAASTLSETGDTTRRPTYVCTMTRETHRVMKEKYAPKEESHEDQ